VIWKEKIDIAQKADATLAYLVGAGWVLWNYWIGRTHKSWVQFRVSGRRVKRGDLEYLVIRAELSNVGRSRVKITPKKQAVDVYAHRFPPNQRCWTRLPKLNDMSRSIESWNVGWRTFCSGYQVLEEINNMDTLSDLNHYNHKSLSSTQPAHGNSLPLTLRMSDGLLVEGIADLVFRESDEWIVVDFKTDQELAAELPAYRRQISIYASTVGKAKNTYTSAFLLRV